MRRSLLVIGAFLATCLLVGVVGQIAALALGLNVDTANGGGSGKAGNTPASVMIGIIALAVAAYVAVRVSRRRV